MRITFYAISLAVLLGARAVFAADDPTLAVTCTLAGQSLTLNWPSASTVPYQAQASTDLRDWSPIGPVLTGNGGTLSFGIFGLGLNQGFFRVQRVFPAAPGTASFEPSTGLLTVVGDLAHTAIEVANDGGGNIIVNGGAMAISGGTPTVSNTVLIQVLGSTGDDQITILGLLPPTHLFGGEGNDTIVGGQNNDLIVGGPGANTLAGGRGNDTIYVEGNDTVVWNPGDGNDVIQGNGTNNTLAFNGANIAENIVLSADGNRLRFTRDVANIVIDAGGIQTVNFRALGGADNITVNDLSSTDVRLVNIDLASSAGGTNGDGAADTVFVNGTSGADTFNVSANGLAVEVSGPGALVHIAGGEAANDRIAIVGVGNDVVNVNGTEGPDTMQILPSTVAGFARVQVSGYSIPVDVSGVASLAVNGLGGPDTIVGANGLASVNVPIYLNGGEGDDLITGTDANDTIDGGPGSNTITPGRGNDFVMLGNNDTVNWNPGDGNDVLQGSGTNNTLAFNGANIAENIVLSADGNRLRFTRDVANIVIDAGGIQTVNFRALGGADNITVNDLSSTDVRLVNIDLASSAGGTNGDGAADTIFVNGTSEADTFNVAANGLAVEVSGPGATVHVTGGEVANDRIAIIGVGNDLVNVNGTDGPDTMQLFTSSVAGCARVQVSGYTIPVDVAGALSLAVNGLGGADTIVGANGLASLSIPFYLNGGEGDDLITGTDAGDTIDGGPGSDTITPGRGSDLVYLGGDDTVIWNPGDGSDVMQGQGPNNTLAFNCANIAEKITLSANGSHLLLTRDVASITLDAQGIQNVNLRMLGGADLITINDLTGTSVTQVNVDLAGTVGGAAGDGAADNIVINGTPGSDAINILANSGAVEVLGLTDSVQILHPDAGLDALTVNGLGGTNSVTTGNGVTSLINVITNP